MFNMKQLDQVSDVVKTQSLPDIVFGNNRLFMVHKKRNFLYEFSPVDALSLSSYEERENRLYNEEEKSDNVNTIDLIPENIEVEQAELWKQKDTSEIKDFK